MAKKVLIVLALILCVALMAPPAHAAKKFLRMASGPEGGSWYPLGSAMMTILQKDLGISTANGPGGGVGNCKVVDAGRADMGWTYTHTSFNAYNGRGKFRKKRSNLRHLMSLYPGIFQIVSPKDSDIKTPADLKNKRIVPGKVGFTGTAIAELVLKAYGLTYQSIKTSGGSVSFVGYSDSAALMKDGHSDCYMAVTSCPQSTIIDLVFRPGVRFLPITPEYQKKIRELEPGLMPTVIPAGSYKGQDKDVNTVGTVTSIVINKNVPDDIAYNIVKSLYASWPELAKVKKKAIEDSKPEKALQGANIPVHPGALKYYKEKGIAK